MGNKASTMDGESTTYFEDFEDASETAASTAVGTQRSTASISSSRMSSSRSTTNNSLPLSYPYDFFNRNTGLGPKNPTEAMALWPYRKNRPANGTVDLEPADGVKMMQEVQGMRDRLKAHIENAFMKDARLMADMWDLKDPRTNEPPQTPKDFVKALVALKRVEGSLESERIVYMVCHHFHHRREWLSNAVDAWCHEENIKIEYPAKEKVVEGVRKRSSQSNRGGFGVCARSVKSEIVKQLMRNMLSQAGWCISTKDNSKQGKGKKYQAISVRIEQAATDHTCYVVTEEDAGKKAAGKKNDAGSATMGSSPANAIDVDNIVSFGAHLCNTLGVAVTEEKLQEICSTYKPPSDVVGLQIDTTNKTPGEDVSDLTIAEEAAAARVSSSAAPSVAAASLTAATNQLAVSSSAAPSDGASSLASTVYTAIGAPV